MVGLGKRRLEGVPQCEWTSLGRFVGWCYLADAGGVHGPGIFGESSLVSLVLGRGEDDMYICGRWDAVWRLAWGPLNERSALVGGHFVGTLHSLSLSHPYDGIRPLYRSRVLFGSLI